MRINARPSRLKVFTIVAIMLLSIVVLLNAGMVQNSQALDPHIITGTVFEANSTLCDNCTVQVMSTRTQESSNTTSNATAVYAFNCLNWPSGWAYSDVVQVTAWNSTNVTGINSTSIKIGSLSTNIDVWIGTISNISGVNFYIVDCDFGLVAGAYINIKDSNGDIVITKLSDENGKASTDLGYGLYTITVSKSGFEDEIRNIRVYGSGCSYFIQIEEEEEGVIATDYFYWAMILFAVIGVIAILAYILKRL